MAKTFPEGPGRPRFDRPATGARADAGAPMAAARFGESEPTRGIAILLPPETDLIDIAGPACVFSSAARCLARAGAITEGAYAMDYLSTAGGPVETRQGLTLDTSALQTADPARYDTIIVTGGEHEAAAGKDPIAEWLKAARPLVRRIASVCTGAFFLARAGLLENKRATTHWTDCGELALQFRATSVDSDAIFIEDDGVWTSAGATAGIDMALAMVEQDHGHDLAMTVARMQVVYLKRHGGQSQYSAHLQSQETLGTLGSLLRWMIANPHADLSNEALANRAHMSVRNFYRSFEAATGQSPGQWVETMRIENAKRMLSRTVGDMERIALESGFGGYERMRRAFARRLGISPLTYRKRFCRSDADADKRVDSAVLTYQAALP